MTDHHTKWTTFLLDFIAYSEGTVKLLSRWQINSYKLVTVWTLCLSRPYGLKWFIIYELQMQLTLIRMWFVLLDVLAEVHSYNTETV